jgi:hypothetical protein
MPDLTLPSDHDILNTLVANVSNMKEGQDRFHQEMKESFRDLKENYADRLSKVENGLSNADKVFLAKKDQDEKDAALDKRITWLERIAYGGLGIIGFIELYFRIIK